MSESSSQTDTRAIEQAVRTMLEAIGDSESGLIVPPRKPEVLADAVVQIVSDPDRAAAMSGAASRRAEDFSVREQVRRTEELYLELASRKGLLP